MRPSPLRHPVAVLRQILGIGQKELAALVNRSPRTIQAVEINKLPLSVELANLLSQETGVALSWLLAGDPTAPPQNGLGDEYTKQDYDKAQGAKFSRNEHADYRYLNKAQASFAEVLPFIAPLIAAANAGKEQIAIFRLSTMYRRLVEEFGLPTKKQCSEISESLFTLTIPNSEPYEIEGNYVTEIDNIGFGETLLRAKDGKFIFVDPQDDEAEEPITEPETPLLLYPVPPDRRSRKGGEPPRSRGR